MDQTKPIPDIIVSRLPVYLRALNHMHGEGKQTVSSKELGERIGISAAQIRKDLSQFGEFGKQGTGYRVTDLVSELRRILQIDRVWDVALIGMGDMGHALARYPGFSDRGFRVTMVFDTDPSKIGQQVGKFTIQDANSVGEAIQRSGIRIAMLCVPAASAQEVANLLVKAGVQSILNYAPISLSVPPGVRVQYLDPSIGLQRMTYYMR